MNKYLVEFLGTLFFLYVILATGNALAIGAALAIAIILGSIHDILGRIYDILSRLVDFNCFMLYFEIEIFNCVGWLLLHYKRTGLTLCSITVWGMVVILLYLINLKLENGFLLH